MKSSALTAGLALLALALPSLAQEVAPEPNLPDFSNCLPLYGKPVPCQDPNQIPPCPPAIVVEEPVGIPVTPPKFPRVWVDGEYMLWWLRPNYINAPLVTSTRAPENLASSVSAGGLDDPNTVVLFGEQNSRVDPQMGGRLTANVALDTEGSVVLQASGFYLPLQVERFFAQSNAAGQPALALPFNQVSLGTPVETSSVIAGPFNSGILHGDVLINNGTEMWGGELNLMSLLACTWVGEFDMIYGARYLYLRDYLTIDTNSDSGSVTHDSFDAKNSFYGGQVGLRYVLDCEYFRLEWTSKFALGDTNELLDITGASHLPTFAAGSTLPGGFYTASSNLGRTSTNRFGFVYEDTVNLVWKVSDCVQLMVGYDYLYWNHVYRSGNQVDHNLNPSLNPALSVITPAGGQAAPERFNAQSDFWAQGITAGVRISF
jgi:Putative beta barrel porin-7 (BBP7)